MKIIIMEIQLYSQFQRKTGSLFTLSMSESIMETFNVVLTFKSVEEIL